MRSSLFLSQQTGLLKACSGNHGNSLSSSSRLPLGVLSTNTLRRSVGSSSAPQLLPAPDGCENSMSRLIQSAAAATEDAEAPLDVWTVIRPGHVREKIAIFASEAGQADRTEGGASNGGSCGKASLSPTAVTALLRAPKAKGSWEENCSAKRRRRSCNNQNLQRDPRPRVALPAQVVEPPPPPPPPLQRVDVEHGEEEEQKVSVVEMVAVLEQRASESPDSKPLLALQRSSTTITLSRAPPPPPSEPRGEGPESLRVSDMVARLESECLKRSSEGSLSRSNSLRRTVGRVLLANMEQSSAPCPPSPSSPPSTALIQNREPISCPETISISESLVSAQTPPLPSVYTDTEAPPLTQATSPESEEAEPLPGLLFLSAPPPTRPSPVSCDSSQSEDRKGQLVVEEEEEEEAGPVLTRACASQDFLQLRERVQQLLQPRPFLWALPHHLLLHILRLLPTHSLAALKCTCTYFKVVMETYGVRPADSLWVSDPRYRDDPCKQCKRRYERGDVSLCRWHHKPFCQALPGGPGYWMCCRGNRRDAPGCNVGLHDNRWVPAFHSIRAPVRRGNNHDD
ncbi:unnamed protein product [Ophioblennius macclurei]